MNIRIAAAALCCLTASCGTPALGPVRSADGASSSKVEVVSASELPPPGRDDLFGQERPYMVGPYDKLIIDVFGIEELSQKEYQLDASGNIGFPLAGTIAAAGKTPAELAAEIESRLRGRYVREPQVTVNLKETVSQVVTVDGQVNEPGLYPVVGRMTLMRAVARAQGLGEYAAQNDVVIFRTVKGQRMAALYDLRAIRRGVYDDPEIFANDVVIVGDSNAKRLFKDALSVIPILSTPLIIALQNQ